jgi:hypothetical protein
VTPDRPVRESLVVQLRAWDDEAWVALANRGLLRRARKDLEQAQPAIEEEDRDQLLVRVGSHVVRFDERGPVQAECTCPSTGPCQHLVAAGLWLTSQGGSGSGPTTAADEFSRHDELSRHDQLMGFGVADLVAHAGRAGHRWAHQYASDLELERDVTVTSGRATSITLASPRVTFRYMGGGLAGLVADVPLPSLERYQAAAVLAYQRAHGTEPEAPPPPQRRTAGGAEPLEPSRARLREATHRLLLDIVRLGLSHLSPAVHERFETVAVWAQGASYHRLAVLLRRLADHVELLLARSAQADEERLLDEAALAFGLVTALEAAAAHGAAPSHLVGRSRSRYDAVRRMEVVGLGSVPWRTGSGYHGLTTLFWWPQEQRFVSVTDARPDTLAMWDPRGRHGAPGPWQGLPSPSAAAGARLLLTDAQLSGNGRLSGVERTQALVTRIDGPQLAQHLPVVTAFDALGGRAAERASLLATPDPLRDWVVLAPAEFGAASFDTAGQRLLWPVRDAGGTPLVLTVAWTAMAAPTVEHVESAAARGVPPGTLVVCRLLAAPQGLTAEPLSLVHPHRLAAEEPVEELHFEASGHRAEPSPRRTGTQQDVEPATTARARLPRELTDLTSWHRRQAERGTAAASPAALAAELDRLHSRLRETGLDLFGPLSGPDAPDRAVPGSDLAERLLASHFVARQVQVLLTGSPEVE